MPRDGGAVALVRYYWHLMASNDFVAVGALLADDFVCDWPQSGERIRGRVNFARVNAEYPAAGSWSFQLRRLVGDEHEAVSEVDVSDGVTKARAISFFTVAGNRITHLVEYWPDPFPAAPNRRHLVERIEPD